jgi:hypothetical protein
MHLCLFLKMKLGAAFWQPTKIDFEGGFARWEKNTLIQAY